MLEPVNKLIQRFRQRDERALARVISLIENGSDTGQAILRELRVPNSAHIIGITGSPGSGKSSLTDQLIACARSKDASVAVIAVDPSSPFTGGAIMGDRIRMMRWHQDPRVYIRSMATRGHLGGLAASTLQVLAVLNAYGFDYIFIETVGVGQSEVDIVKTADTTVLLLTPGQGDGVQAFKAGIMEIADIFVINKCDQPGAARLKREVQAALELAHPADMIWLLPVLETSSTKTVGIEDLFATILRHGNHLSETAQLRTKQQQREHFEVAALLSEKLRLLLQQQGAAFTQDILSGKLSLPVAVRQLLHETKGDS